MLQNIIRQRIQDSKNTRQIVKENTYDDFIETPIETTPSEWQTVTYPDVTCLERQFTFDDAKVFLFFIMETYKIGIKYNHYPFIETDELNVKVRLYTKNINDITDIDFKIAKEIIDVHNEIDFLNLEK
jgi:pterin-4a-carbinolamine dehydratase